MNLTIWKKPTLPSDELLDVHDAATQAIDRRRLRITKELHRLQRDIISNTNAAIRAGKLYAWNMEHTSYLPEVIKAAENWLKDKGYDTGRKYLDCRCGGHLTWSWEFKVKQSLADDPEPTIPLGKVTRLPPLNGPVR